MLNLYGFDAYGPTIRLFREERLPRDGGGTRPGAREMVGTMPNTKQGYKDAEEWSGRMNAESYAAWKAAR